MHTLCTEFRRKSGLAARTVSETVANEGCRDCGVVDEASFLEAIETRVDTGTDETFLLEPALQLRAGARSIGNEVQSGVAYPEVAVRIEEGIPRRGREWIAHAEAAPLQGFEHDLEGFAAVEMNQNSKSARAEGLNSGDERGRGHAQ